MGGWPADMHSICDLAKAYVFVVEDCAQAHGAAIALMVDGDQLVLSLTFQPELCQDKIISTGGEGGLVTTNSQEIFEKIWSFKDHGKTVQSVFSSSHPPGFDGYMIISDLIFVLPNFRVLSRIQLKNTSME